jgi:hypothetical protein
MISLAESDAIVSAGAPLTQREVFRMHRTVGYLDRNLRRTAISRTTHLHWFPRHCVSCGPVARDLLEPDTAASHADPTMWG